MGIVLDTNSFGPFDWLIQSRVFFWAEVGVCHYVVISGGDLFAGDCQCVLSVFFEGRLISCSFVSFWYLRFLSRLLGMVVLA